MPVSPADPSLRAVEGLRGRGEHTPGSPAPSMTPVLGGPSATRKESGGISPGREPRRETIAYGPQPTGNRRVVPLGRGQNQQTTQSLPVLPGISHRADAA